MYERLGQGIPLPHDFPHKGEWLIKDKLFLYRPDPSEFVTGDIRATVFWTNVDGSSRLGFDAGQIANAMGIEIDALFLANRSHTLDLATREVPPAKGGTAAKQYVFTLGDKTAALVVEAMSQAGRA